jgi:DNA-binding transcriptional ArsR family regulator
LFTALDGTGGLLYLTDQLFNRIAKLSLDTAFAALSDPTRRAILARLALGETSVTELAKPFAMSLPAVSKHLKVLERAGLIARGREAQWRPCRIEPRALKDIDNWLNHYRRFFDESFDRLDAYLQKLQAQDQTQDHDKARDKKRIEERSNDQPNAKNRKDRRNKPRRS